MRAISSRTTFLFALLLCNSRQMDPSPSRSRRLWTTSRAAIFSATKSTFLPALTAVAVRLVIVCDFPVPGGPWMTRCLPRRTSSMATACELSASVTWIMFAGGISESILSPSSHKLGSETNPPPRRLDRVGLLPSGVGASRHVSGSRSRYIRYLANEKNQTIMSSPQDLPAGLVGERAGDGVEIRAGRHLVHLGDFGQVDAELRPSASPGARGSS